MSCNEIRPIDTAERELREHVMSHFEMLAALGATGFATLSNDNGLHLELRNEKHGGDFKSHVVDLIKAHKAGEWSVSTIRLPWPRQMCKDERGLYVAKCLYVRTAGFSVIVNVITAEPEMRTFEFAKMAEEVDHLIGLIKEAGCEAKKKVSANDPYGLVLNDIYNVTRISLSEYNWKEAVRTSSYYRAELSGGSHLVLRYYNNGAEMRVDFIEV